MKLKKPMLKKLGVITLSATILAGGILPSVSYASSIESEQTLGGINDVIDMNAFDQLVREVESGKITNEDEAENRLEELQDMNLPPKLTRGSSNNKYLVNAKEVSLSIAAVGAINTAKAKIDADKAVKATANSGLSGSHNGRADAFRHAYWNALMAKNIGTTNAVCVASIHEAVAASPKIQKDMDLHNNKKGRDAYNSLRNVGKSTSDSSLITRVKNDISQGQMKYIKDGKLIATNK